LILSEIKWFWYFECPVFVHSRYLNFTFSFLIVLYYFFQDEKDKQLQEKELELRRMQEMVAAMQEQIKQQSVSSLQSLVSNHQ
jgi:hypothetical protein